MILYLDTSSLVKLHVDEEGSQLVRGLVKRATVVATSGVAYVEARAAFARKRREAELTDEELQRVRGDFESDWEKYLTVEVSKSIVTKAGNLAEKHSLRGFDAVHLASALTLTAGLGSEVEFSCADQRLLRAAVDEGLGAAQ